MLNKLRKINEKLIKLNHDNQKILNKQLLIQKILKEEDCFQKIDVETAFNILKDLQIPQENLKNIYLSLI